MSIFGNNLKQLRKKRGLTQAQLADKIGVNRSAIGAYEEGRAEPRMKTLVVISNYFKVTTDALLNPSASHEAKDTSGKYLRVLPIVIEKQTDQELISLVPVKASAGYLNGYADIDFIEELPQITLPVKELAKDRTYRAFEISGDSMLPIPSGSYIICMYEENWNNIKDNKPYVIVSKEEGITYKRVENLIAEESCLLLKPDNPEFQSFKMTVESIEEIWKALGYLSFELPKEGNSAVGSLDAVHQMLYEMKKDLKKMGKA